MTVLKQTDAHLYMAEEILIKKKHKN